MAFKSVVECKLKVNLVCTVAMVENLLGHKAYHPMDIIKSHKGLTVEIGNTDAEGRLILCDAMSWT
jgi:leucyl aminopeptidase